MATKAGPTNVSSKGLVRCRFGATQKSQRGDAVAEMRCLVVTMKIFNILGRRLEVIAMTKEYSQNIVFLGK